MRDAVRSLVEKKIVVKHKEGTQGLEKCWYSLSVEEPTEFKDSNNSYPHSKNGGTPILKTDTKETPTKEKEEKREGASPPNPPSLIFFGNLIFDSVKFATLEYDYGVGEVRNMMEELQDYSETRPKEFKKYACHVAVLRTWLKRKAQKQKLQPQKSKENDKAWAYSLERKIGTNKGFSVHSESVCFSIGNWSTSIPYIANGFKQQVEAQLRKMNLWKPEFKDLK